MDKKILWVGFSSLAIVLAATLLTFFFTKPASFRGTAYNEPYPRAPEFKLTDSKGKSFQLSDQSGKIVLIFFGYTSCTDVCPTTMAELNAALKAIPEKADSVKVVFITVDPDRDTPKIVQEYVARFNPSFIWLSGSQAELEKIWKDYGVFREIVKGNSAMGYVVNHTARVTLIDADGKLRLSYGSGAPVEDIVNDLKLLLK
jgi:protein SCO1/2